MTNNKMTHKAVKSEFEKIQSDLAKAIEKAKESAAKKRSQLQKKCLHRYTYTPVGDYVLHCKACNAEVYLDLNGNIEGVTRSIWDQ